MLRQCITYLRTRGFSTILPLDNHIYLHKLTGSLIALWSLVHTLMHLLNLSLIVVHDLKINRGNHSLSEWLFTTRPQMFGFIQGFANPSGVALFVILSIIFVCSQPFVRQKRSFEVFYWSHLLYIPFWMIVILHGPNFWKWLIGPGVVYVIERILRYIWMKSNYGKTYISSGLLLPSKVTHLVIKRPLHFHFRPGDYVFVNIPVIASYEWHPFTISSAPEQEDYMWLHIRGVGEWTNTLYEYFEKEQQRLYNGDRTIFHQPNAVNKNNSVPKVEENILTPGKESSRNLTKPNRDQDGVNHVNILKTDQSFKLGIKSTLTVNKVHENPRSSKNSTATFQRMFPGKKSADKGSYVNFGYDSCGENKTSKVKHEKALLGKSFSLPDIQNKIQRRTRLLTIEYK